MKFLCDVNIAIRVAKFLAAQGAEVAHVNQLRERWNTSDQKIREMADAQQAIVVSKDSDFRDSFLLRGTPKKLVHVCLGNAATDDIIELPRLDWSVLLRYVANDRFYLELNYHGLIAVVA